MTPPGRRSLRPEPFSTLLAARRGGARGTAPSRGSAVLDVELVVAEDRVAALRRRGRALQQHPGAVGEDRVARQRERPVGVDVDAVPVVLADHVVTQLGRGGLAHDPNAVLLVAADVVLAQRVVLPGLGDADPRLTVVVDLVVL